MADDQQHTCGERKVKTLSSIEHIRLRTGSGAHYKRVARKVLTRM